MRKKKNSGLGRGLDAIFFDNTPVEEISDAFPLMSNTQIRTALGRFLLKGDNALKKISTLSGGERARVCFALLMLENADHAWQAVGGTITPSVTEFHRLAYEFVSNLVK